MNRGYEWQRKHSLIALTPFASGDVLVEASVAGKDGKAGVGSLVPRG